MTAPVSDPDRKNWKSLIPHRDNLMVEGLEMFADFMVLNERENGFQQLRILDLRNGNGDPKKPRADYRIAFPEAVYAAGPGPNREWNTSVIRYNYQSPITPNSAF